MTFFTARRAAALVTALVIVPAAVDAQQIVGLRDARALRTGSVFRRFDAPICQECGFDRYAASLNAIAWG